MLSVKIKVEFDGWKLLSKKQIKEILQQARQKFINANFSGNHGLLLESKNEMEVFDFCLKILEQYKEIFYNWNGYKISKISQKIILNYADKKRKLNRTYFEKLIRENSLEDIKLIIAGSLYLDPDTAIDILMKVQRELNNTFRQMDDEELNKAYQLLLMNAAEFDRNF